MHKQEQMKFHKLEPIREDLSFGEYMERLFWYGVCPKYNVIQDWVIYHPETQGQHTNAFKQASQSYLEQLNR